MELCLDIPLHIDPDDTAAVLLKTFLKSFVKILCLIADRYEATMRRFVSSKNVEKNRVATGPHGRVKQLKIKRRQVWNLF